MHSQPPETVTVEPPPHNGADMFLKRVLVAEDDPLYRCILERVLSERGYRVESVQDGTEALRMSSSSGAPRLILLDWMMPGISGPEICKELRRKSMATYPYIILLSANDKKADVVAGLEAGADDYLTKPFDSHELLARLRVGVRMITLQNSLLAAQERLRFQATHDSLTGIWNRGALLELLGGELERAHRRHSSLAVLMLDLDHFKKINDEFGHQTGDSVLQEVATRLAATVRVYDLIGRYGGEEFLVVAELEPSQVQEYAERLRLTVAIPPLEIDGHWHAVSVSIGIAVTDSTRAWDVAEVVGLADGAMYSAKRAGRNRFVLANGSLLDAKNALP